MYVRYEPKINLSIAYGLWVGLYMGKGTFLTTWMQNTDATNKIDIDFAVSGHPGTLNNRE